MENFELPDLDKIQENVKKFNEQQGLQSLRLAEEIYHAFNSPTGKKVLEFLEEQTINKSTLDTNFLIVGNNFKADQYMFIREGQNQVTRFIKEKVKEYKERGEK